MQQQAALNPDTSATARRRPVDDPERHDSGPGNRQRRWRRDLAVAIIGALRRWTWVFYAVLVLLGLSTVSFPFSLISAFTTSAMSPLKLPVGVTAASVAFGIPAVALFVWMAVAAFRRGPWAMTRVAPS